MTSSLRRRRSPLLSPVGLVCRALSWAVSRLRIGLAPRVRVQGVCLVDLGPRTASVDPALAAKVDEALQIIAHYAPERLGRFRRDVKRIMLRRIPGARGGYSTLTGSVVLDPDFVRRRGNAQVALTLVHEATHARLFRAGFGYGPEVRGRIERVCRRAEIALAERIPGSEAVLRRLGRDLHASGLTDPQLGAYLVEQARAAGSPEWVVRRIRRRYGIG